MRRSCGADPRRRCCARCRSLCRRRRGNAGDRRSRRVGAARGSRRRGEQRQGQGRRSEWEDDIEIDDTIEDDDDDNSTFIADEEEGDEDVTDIIGDVGGDEETRDGPELCPGFPARLSGGFGAIAQLGERLHGMQEVGGSIPPGSTSLRLLRKLRLGARPDARSEASEACRVVARRAKTGTQDEIRFPQRGRAGGGRYEVRLHFGKSRIPKHFYIGITDDLTRSARRSTMLARLRILRNMGLHE